MKQVREQLHQLTDHIQGVIGMLELGRYPKALKAAKLAAIDIQLLAQTLRGEILPECERCPVRNLVDESEQDDSKKDKK